MLSYEEFEIEFEKELKNRYPEKEIIRRPQYKFNGIKHGLTIMGTGDIHPTVYPKDFYELYQEYEEIELVVDAVDSAIECEKVVDFKNILLDWSQVKEHIFPFIINLEKNESCLECNDYIFKKKLDFAYGVYVDLLDDDGGHANVNITKSMLELWEVSEEEIFNVAARNAKYNVKPMKQVIAELTGLDCSEIDISEDNAMYVLSNETRNRGAAGILDLELLNNTAENLQSAFYILPSSIHELIFLLEEQAPSAETLKEMVKEINQTQVRQEEFLSDNIYYYSRETQDVSIVEFD